MTKRLYILCLILSIICFTSVSFAVDANTAKNLQKTKTELSKSNQAIKKKKSAKTTAEKKLNTVKSELLDLTKDNHATARKLRALTSERNDLQRQLDNARTQLLEDQNLSAGLIYKLHEQAQIPPYSLYLSTENKADIMREITAIKIALPHIKNRMQSSEAEIADIQNLKTKLNANINEAERTQTTLNKNLENIEELIKSRKSLYQKANASYASSLKKIKTLKKQAKNLEDLVAKLKPALKPALKNPAQNVVKNVALTPPPIKEKSRKKGYPVIGDIKVKYGATDEIGGKNQGLIFTTDSKTLAVAPLSGNVVFSGPFQHFKRLLIIEHDKGYHSLIAGLDNISVNVGERVTSGEPVGRVNRKDKTQGRVYFELRKNGKPVNPKSIFKS